MLILVSKGDDMIKNLYVSNSSIQVFKQCRKRFKYKYIDKVNTGARVTSKYLSFGNSIHAALANYNYIDNPEYRNLETLHNLLRRNWIREGYADIDEERQYGIKGLKMLETYFNEPLDSGKENLIIEEMIKRKINDSSMLCGKIDKAYIRADDAVEVIDYKTSEKVERDPEFSDDIQLPIYLLLVKEKLGRYPSTISYYYLPNNRKAAYDISDKEISSAKDTIGRVVEDIQKEVDYLPSSGQYCFYSCEYQNLCIKERNKTSVLLQVQDKCINNIF